MTVEAFSPFTLDFSYFSGSDLRIPWKYYCYFGCWFLSAIFYLFSASFFSISIWLFWTWSFYY